MRIAEMRKKMRPWHSTCSSIKTRIRASSREMGRFKNARDNTDRDTEYVFWCAYSAGILDEARRISRLTRELNKVREKINEAEMTIADLKYEEKNRSERSWDAAMNPLYKS